MSSEDKNISTNYGIPGESVTLDNARLRDDSSLKYPYFFWSGYKHHVRGLLAGIALGALIGGLVGLAVFAFAPAIGVLGVLAFTGGGILFGAEQVGSIGTASGTRASGLAESHARALDPANEGDPVKIANDKLMYNGERHHYEYPEDRDTNKLFSFKSGLTGLGIGAIAGALVGKFAIGFPVVSAVAKVAAIAALGHVAAPIVAGAIVFGILGLSFGIERGIFKSIFNTVSSITEGKGRITSQDLGREQAAEQGTEPELMARRLTRQQEMYDLRTEYDEKIFLNGIRGYIKGAVGGSLIGAFFGAALGLLAFGALALIAPVSIGVIVGVFAGAGALYGLKTFSEAGYNAGAEATARSIDDEFKLKQAQEAGLVAEIPPSPGEPKKGLIASSFSKLLGGVGKVSGESKDIYESVYDTDAVDPKEAAALVESQQQAAYAQQVTPADAEKLNARLNDTSNKRSFSDMITQQQQTPQPGVQL
jgi:hypothetical protein